MEKNNYAILIWHNEKILQVRTLYCHHQYVVDQVKYMKTIKGTKITDFSIVKTVAHSVPEIDESDYDEYDN